MPLPGRSGRSQVIPQVGRHARPPGHATAGGALATHKWTRKSLAPWRVRTLFCTGKRTFQTGPIGPLANWYASLALAATLQLGAVMDEVDAGTLELAGLGLEGTVDIPSLPRCHHHTAHS